MLLTLGTVKAQCAAKELEAFLDVLIQIFANLRVEAILLITETFF